MNLRKIKDASHIDRVKALVEKFGDNPKHYLSQLSRVKGDKLRERVISWYNFLEDDYPTVVNALRENYPDILKDYESPNSKVKREQKEEEERIERRRLEKEEYLKRESEGKEIARQGGPGYVNFKPSGGDSFMAAPDKLFYSLSKKPGVIVVKKQGDTSVGAPYERRDGRVWTIAYNYSVEFQGKQLSFNVATLSNEGYDPGSKGWVTTRNGGRTFTGKSFGWLLGRSDKMTWSEVRSRIKSQLSTIGL